MTTYLHTQVSLSLHPLPAPRWRLLPWLANPGSPAMSPHAEGENKTHTRPTDKTVERKGGMGGETASKDSTHSGKTQVTLRKTLTKTPTKLPQCPMDQEHKESWCMCISNTALTAQVKVVLLVVNSVKLHILAFKEPYSPRRRNWNFLGVGWFCKTKTFREMYVQSLILLGFT